MWCFGAGPTGQFTNGVPGAQALKSGRTRAELLGAAIAQTRRLTAPDALEQAYTTQAMALGAFEQAYTTHAGAGLIAIELKSGKIVHQSTSFHDLSSWLPVEARGNIRVSLDSRDGDDFHSFCQSVVRDAGEPYGETFLDHDKVVGRGGAGRGSTCGRSITVRFFTRVPGPPGLRNPEWLLMVRAVKLTLVGVQPRQVAGELPAAGRRLFLFGQARVPEAIGVFTSDLSGGTPQQWTVQAAHIRNLLDLEVGSGTYDMDVGQFKPFEALAMLFFEHSKEGGVAGSMFSRAAAQLEYAATSALSWLTRQALKATIQWSLRVNEDDTVSLAHIGLFTLLGGLSNSVSMDLVCGKPGFSYGGLDVLYFIADPAEPLDGNLRATFIRIASAKTVGEFDVHRPFIISCKWSSEISQVFCKRISINMAGQKMASEEDVSQILEKLKISPGGGHLSDGDATICVGQSGV